MTWLWRIKRSKRVTPFTCMGHAAAPLVGILRYKP